MKISFNYSKIKNRDKKLYSIQGTKVSSTGVSFRYMKVMFSVMAIMNIIGVIICIIGGKIYYIPISEGMEIKLGFPLFFLGSPFAIAAILLYTRVYSYTLLDLLSAYFKPKHTRDQNGKVLGFRNNKFKAFIERVF